MLCACPPRWAVPGSLPINKRNFFMRWIALALLGAVACAQAADIKVLSGNGAKGAVARLGAEFQRASGHQVSIHFYVNPEVRKRIEGGEPFDVAILNPPVLDALIRE